MHIPPEPPAVIQEYRPSPSWPSQGNIEIQNLMVLIISENYIIFLFMVFFICPILALELHMVDFMLDL